MPDGEGGDEHEWWCPYGMHVEIIKVKDDRKFAFGSYAPQPQPAATPEPRNLSPMETRILSTPASRKSSAMSSRKSSNLSTRSACKLLIMDHVFAVIWFFFLVPSSHSLIVCMMMRPISYSNIFFIQPCTMCMDELEIDSMSGLLTAVSQTGALSSVD